MAFSFVRAITEKRKPFDAIYIYREKQEEKQDTHKRKAGRKAGHP